VCAGHGRGSKKGAGRVGGRRGRETRRRARVRTRMFMTRVGKAELTRQAHSAERENGTHGVNGSALANRAHETERESERAKETGVDRLVSLGSEREREGARERGTAADRRGPPVRRRGRAAWLGLVSGWAALRFSFSLDFLIPFLFLFYRVFNSKFKLGFKFKLIQTSETIQRIFKLSMMQHVMTHKVLAKINN
jgi:hypothetical protein